MNALDVNYQLAVERWYDEVKDFNPSKGGKHGGVVGHYTQVVAEATKFVGCGSIVFKAQRGYTWHFACNYGPGGNYVGRPAYKRGETASECPNGSNDGLCK